jgi:predicted amidohydrolase
MVIGLVPAMCKNDNIDYNLSQLFKFLEIASHDQIDYIFFGESFLQGFDSLSWSFEKDKTVAISRNSLIIDSIKDKARHFGVGIGFGYFELSKESIYSSYLVISPQGKVITNYRRISKGWKEVSKTDHHYKEGKSIVQIELESYKFTLALCGDLWDEQSYLLFLNESVHNTKIIWPVYVDFSKEEWLKELHAYNDQAMKFSNHVFLVNNIAEPNSHGGAFHFNKAEFEAVEFDKEDILRICL